MPAPGCAGTPGLRRVAVASRSRGFEHVIVSPLVLRAEESSTRVVADVASTRNGNAALWWRVPAEASAFIAGDRLDAALLALLVPAMAAGEDLVLAGNVSSRLMFFVRNYTIPLLQDFWSKLKPIRITAEHESDFDYRGAGVGTGFSAGVDSYCTLVDRYLNESSPANKINTLLFINAGSHGKWDQNGGPDFAPEKFKTRYANLSRIATEFGLPLFAIDTNLHYFNRWGNQYTHPLVAASVVLLLQRHFSRYYYSSAGLDFGGMMKYQNFYRAEDLGAWCDPILLPQISTESVELISDGCAYSRVEKLQRIAEFWSTHRNLNVCTAHIEGWENCSQCEKCMRTMFALDVLGHRDRFKGAFDWHSFDRRKRNFLDNQALKRALRSDPFAIETVDLAHTTGYPLPRLLSAVARRSVRRTAREIRDGLGRARASAEIAVKHQPK